MCLHVVESTKRDRKREGFGWKVFCIKNGCLHGEFFGGSCKAGVWLKSRNDKIDASEDYPLGFHIFRTRREARAWKGFSFSVLRPLQRVRKVRFRDVLAEGRQMSGGRVIVAKEMMIL